MTYLKSVLYFVDRASRHKFLEITNLMQFSYVYLFHVSTCFERHRVHHQEIEFYYYIICYDYSV